MFRIFIVFIIEEQILISHKPMCTRNNLSFTILLMIISFSLYAQNRSLDLDSIFNEGMRYMDQYDYKKASECFYTCQRKDNKQPQYHYYLARAYEQLGNVQDARMFYRKAWSLDSLQVRYIMALGNIELQRRDYHAARNYFEGLIRLDSTNSFYYKKVGKTCYYGNDIPCAIQSFQYSLYYNNRDLESIGMLAQIFYESLNYDLCLDLMRKGLLLDDQNPKFLNLKLKTEVKSEAYESAVTTAERIFDVLDSSSQILKFYGIALCKTGQYEKSINILSRLIENKEDEGIHYFLSESYAAMDEPEKSIKHLEDAAYRFGIGPMVWRYFYKLSGLYEKTGRMKDAVAFMERAYDLHHEPLLMFQLARLTDNYYLDKRMAINRYDQYLATDDSLYREYAEDRISTIKQFLHQSKAAER